MTEAQQTNLLIRGTITEFPQEVQTKIHEAAEKFRQLMKEAGEGIGEMALTLVGSEIQMNN